MAGFRTGDTRADGGRGGVIGAAEADTTGRGRGKTIDELLAAARAVLPHRPCPAEALRAQADGAVLVDMRGDDQRRAGLIPGALVLPRNSLEWRCDPASEWRHPAIDHWDLRIILVCQEGYQSSLAAATLQQLGLLHATDLDGGFIAWAAAGLPVLPGRDVPADCHIGMTRNRLAWTCSTTLPGLHATGFRGSRRR